MKTNKNMDRLQGNANTREAGTGKERETGNIAAARQDKRSSQGTKEFEQHKSKSAASDKSKELGDETEIDDETTI